MNNAVIISNQEMASHLLNQRLDTADMHFNALGHQWQHYARLVRLSESLNRLHGARTLSVSESNDLTSNIRIIVNVLGDQLLDVTFGKYAGALALHDMCDAIIAWCEICSPLTCDEDTAFDTVYDAVYEYVNGPVPTDSKEVCTRSLSALWYG